jgi:hypothetical protein
MATYDLHILQPSEFEEITRDLLQKEWNCFIESFTSGRDGGIDLRCASEKGGKVIIQAKRYKDYKSLLINLKGEVDKVHRLNPERYYVSTSVGLTPANKEEIKQLFTPYIIDVADIFGNDDLNNLLGRHCDVEKQYYKLWLTSTNVLNNIIHKAPVLWSDFELEDIKANISTYVMNDSFYSAKKILSHHNYVIISGIPGIGKTTLARMLIYDYLANGFEEFINISGDIDTAAKLYKHDKKQVFFFDDFLGASVFEDGGTGFAQKLLTFIRQIKTNKSKAFILTTREYILAEARTHYEKMRTENIEMAKCILDVGAYTRTVKAKILYNHMANAQLPQEYIAQFLKNQNYNLIINHHNYNPRIIETYIDKGLWELTDPANFMSRFKNLLSNPFLVWEIAFEKLPNECKYALLLLVTMGELVTLEDWEMAYNYFCQNVTTEITLSYDGITWNRVVKLLHDCFIRTQRKQEWIIVTTYNPSVRDFLITYIGQNTNIQRSLIQHSLFPEQLTYAFTETGSNNYNLPDYFQRNYSSLDIKNEPYLVAKFNEFLTKQPKSCKIKKISNGLVKSSFDAAIFIKQFLDCFPELFRTLSTKIKSYLIELITTGNSENFAERIGIVNAIDFSEDQTTLAHTLTKLSKEDIPLDEYVSFIDLVNRSNNASIINDCFIENLEEAIISDMDTSINNEAEYEQQKEIYEEIAQSLPDGVTLDRVFEHLEEIEASLPDEPDYYDEDYYRENHGTYEAEDAQIDRMMQSLRN